MVLSLSSEPSSQDILRSYPDPGWGLWFSEAPGKGPTGADRPKQTLCRICMWGTENNRGTESGWGRTPVTGFHRHQGLLHFIFRGSGPHLEVLGGDSQLWTLLQVVPGECVNVCVCVCPCGTGDPAWASHMQSCAQPPELPCRKVPSSFLCAAVKGFAHFLVGVILG